MSQKAPRQFFKPLAAGAPKPMRDLPTRVERMIQFVPPHLDKVRAKVPGMAEDCDVVLGNLEDECDKQETVPTDALPCNPKCSLTEKSNHFVYKTVLIATIKKISAVR